MREVIEAINKKIWINQIGEQTEWKMGYDYGLRQAIELIENGISTLIIPNNNYFVIMYQNGQKYMPYVQEMRLYKINISENGRKTYLFSKNINATMFNTYKPDLVLRTDKALIDRVYFTKEQAEKSI